MTYKLTVEPSKTARCRQTLWSASPGGICRCATAPLRRGCRCGRVCGVRCGDAQFLHGGFHCRAFYSSPGSDLLANHVREGMPLSACRTSRCRVQPLASRCDPSPSAVHTSPTIPGSGQRKVCACGNGRPDRHRSTPPLPTPLQTWRALSSPRARISVRQKLTHALRLGPPIV